MRSTIEMTVKSESIAVFCDETYPDGTKDGRIVSVSIATPRDAFEERIPVLKALAQMGRRRSNRELKAFLDQPAFLVSVVSIDRSAVYGTALHYREEFSDVPSLSRTDNLWGQALGYSVAYLIRLISRYWKLWPITVYYDARRLSLPLQEGIEASIQSTVPRLAAEELHQMRRPGRIAIEAVVAVCKPSSRQMFRPENDGIWLVDATTRLVAKLPPEDFGPNFLFRDATAIASHVAGAIR